MAVVEPLNVYVGCAGWGIPKEFAARFPDMEGGMHLHRYAGRFRAVEINSTFYRPHRPATYERWAASVPDAFRFALKMPRQITHQGRLAGPVEPLDAFLADAARLGPKRGPLLVQLQPSLAFDPDVATAFFSSFRERFDGGVVCEPRHPSWSAHEAEALFAAFQVARVAADPAPVPEAAHPGGWNGLIYYRLHGSPRRYYSEYGPEYLDTLAQTLAAHATSAPTWCIFDNTAGGAATGDALGVLERLTKETTMP